MKLTRVLRYGGDWSPPAAVIADQDGMAAAVGLDWNVELVYVDDDEIKRLNKDYRAKDEVTDVLSFSDLCDGGSASPTLREGEHYAATDLWLDAISADSDSPVGEIIVAPDFIRERCGREGWDVDDEFAMLTIHGLLHVLGWDHKQADEQRRMRVLEQELLSACGRNHPLLKEGCD